MKVVALCATTFALQCPQKQAYSARLHSPQVQVEFETEVLRFGVGGFFEQTPATGCGFGGLIGGGDGE